MHTFELAVYEIAIGSSQNTAIKPSVIYLFHNKLNYVFNPEMGVEFVF